MRILIPLIALVGFACASSTPQSNPAPAAAPDTPKPEEVDPSAQIAGDTQSPTESETQPVISEEDRAQARNLIAQGQELQREKGEGGAEEAISLYRQALELDPEATEAYWELGWSYQVLDELDEALTAWDRVRELAPDYPELELYYPVLKMRHAQQEKLQALPEPGMIPEPELEPYRGPSVRFAAVGDVQTGRAWPEHRTVLPPNEGQGYFDGVKEWLQDADVTFGNLEEVLADEGNSTKCGPKSTKCFAFRVPTSHAELFKDAGFDMMSVANNHAGDFGPAGRQATKAAMDAAGIDYSYTIKADPRFLDWATATRRGAILWWKPAHCCTFVGWVEREGRQYAAILDNNYPGRFELTPREQFVRLWAGYGGFALTVMEDPASSLPYRSYEVINEG